ncbi:MAG: TrbC/VirB2 family protein, partial [Candidatus Peribacteraceae bacterium]
IAVPGTAGDNYGSAKQRALCCDHMRRYAAKATSALLGLLMPMISKAQGSIDTLDTSQWGFDVTAEDIVNNVANTLQSTVIAVATVSFIVGATMYIFGGQKEDAKSSGRKYMMAAVIGVGIVMAAKQILNLVMRLIYG